MSESNIFDLFDTSDLPDNLKNDLKRFKRSETEERIINLLRLADEDLSLNQLQVGYYRKYGEVKERRKLTAKLYIMCKSDNPVVTSVKGKKGKYRLIQRQTTIEKHDNNLTIDESEIF